MKIAICDDDAYFREQIEGLVQKYISGDLKKTVSVFSHAEELLEDVNKNGGFDIYLLDIVMPAMNGIDLGKELRKNGQDGKIIYLTSSAEFAIDSYEAEASSYILKPIDEEKFVLAFDKAVTSVCGKKEKHILVKTKESTVKINFDSILYAELSNRSVIYHLTGGKSVESISIRTNFSDSVSTLTEDERFFLCGASMIVNMHHITEADSGAVVFSDKSKAFLGKKALRDLKSAWIEFCLKEVDTL